MLLLNVTTNFFKLWWEIYIFDVITVILAENENSLDTLNLTSHRQDFAGKRYSLEFK